MLWRECYDSVMSKPEMLLRDAESLTNAERRRLGELLLRQAALEAEAEDTAAGLRGLRAWTAATLEDDWSAYYPDRLRTGRRSGQ